ncbi:unnamed protein product [Schistosoma mattheei]|uniref:Uncharacterized protein n=1 Tax=Schistosoma mattheei TaxID=31246 RepID=A0A183P731_9TREM|nr:unnamed protein product [Schistosoma mattheei]
MSTQFYCMERKPGELRKPSSRRYRCLLTAVYAKYLRSVGQTLSATTTTVRENSPDLSGGRNQEEVLEVDMTHIEESTQLHHKQSTRSKEKRTIKKHITPRKEERHEKNEQQLDRTRNEFRGRSGLENAGRRPMLY